MRNIQRGTLHVTINDSNDWLMPAVSSVSQMFAEFDRYDDYKKI